MPQIWPMNWIFLFSLFVVTFTMFLSFTYFMEYPSKINLEKLSPGVNLTSLDWKW